MRHSKTEKKFEDFICTISNQSHQVMWFDCGYLNAPGHDRDGYTKFVFILHTSAKCLEEGVDLFLPYPTGSLLAKQ